MRIKEKQANKPWITPEIFGHIKERHKLYRKFVKRSLTFGVQYRELRNRVTIMLKDAKIRYYNNKFHNFSGNYKKTWKLINEVVKGENESNTNIHSININNENIQELQIISNYFNNYFASIGQNISDQLSINNTSPISYLSSTYPDFTLSDTTPDEIIDIFKSLNDSAPRYDGIYIKTIKLMSTVLAPHISQLVNLSFHQGIFPDSLKVAKVIPIHKGGKFSDPNNYRPISVLPILSKIYERAMYDRVVVFLNTNNTQTDSQFGFRKKLFPKLAIVQLINYVLQELGHGKYVITVFLDLRKAFNTLNHEILIKKLCRYGIRNVCLEWFEKYLCNRTQYTSIDSTDSGYAIFRTRVPQGSTLGPLLFLLHK